MEERENKENLNLIPTDFYSFSTGRPFERCIECDKYLLDDELYMIEKAIKQYPGYSAQDVIFEYAICLDCADRMKNDLSKESMINIQNWFTENIDPSRFWNGVGSDECLVSGDKKSELQEYQIYAYCKGRSLSNFQPPFMIGGPVLDKLADLMSDETTDELNRFMDKHFGPPPEWLEDVPGGRKLIFI